MRPSSRWASASATPGSTLSAGRLGIGVAALTRLRRSGRSAFRCLWFLALRGTLMTIAFDLDEAAARVVADPLDRALFQMLGRQRTHAITVQRVNRLFRFSLTRQPVTIRQGYYHLDVHSLIAKTEVGYGVTQELMNQMLEVQIIDPNWVVDLSRNPLIWPGYDGVVHALQHAAETYYKNLWRHEPHYVQVWIEKQALIETVREICMQRCASLWPARGYSSLSFLRSATKEIIEADRPTFIYVFGDYDAAGWFAAEHIDKKLNEYAYREGFRHEIIFERVGLTPDQIVRYGLPTRPSKEVDERARPVPNARAFRAMQELTLTGQMARLIGQSCELDALDPNDLRNLVRSRLVRHLSDVRLAELEAEEVAERDEIMRLVRLHRA
jgi:hypothetical protein